MSGPSLAARLAKIEEHMRVVADLEEPTLADLIIASYASDGLDHPNASLGQRPALPLRSPGARRLSIVDLILASGKGGPEDPR
jgi:hypothetical protein